VAVSHVVKRYGSVVALAGASMSVPDRSLTVVLGPSGSGKSTLLRLIAGFEEPDSGVIYFDEKRATLPPEERGVGMVFQSFSLFPHMSVRENILFGVKMQSSSEREKIARQMAELVGVSERLDAKPEELSGGEQQRVALARALAVSPRLLLLDEPFSNLDARLREELRWELKKIHTERGLTTVHVTHDHVEALALADRLVVMRGGRVEQEGDVTEVTERPKNQFVAWFLGYNIVTLDGEPVWFRPHRALITDDGELEGSVVAVQRSPFGMRVRVEGDGWNIEVLSGEKTPDIASRARIKLLEKGRFREGS